MNQLTFSLEEHHANHSQSLVSEKEWMTRAVTWHSSISELLTSSNPSGSFGKTFQVSSVQKEDGILVPSSGRWGNSGMGSPTECSTLNTSEFRSAAVESSLLAVLETGEVPQRFFLSKKACSGILRRAEVRGKKLPPLLHQALQSTIDQLTQSQPDEETIQPQTP